MDQGRLGIVVCFHSRPYIRWGRRRTNFASPKLLGLSLCFFFFPPGLFESFLFTARRGHVRRAFSLVLLCRRSSLRISRTVALANLHSHGFFPLDFPSSRRFPPCFWTYAFSGFRWRGSVFSVWLFPCALFLFDARSTPPPVRTDSHAREGTYLFLNLVCRRPPPYLVTCPTGAPFPLWSTASTRIAGGGTGRKGDFYPVLAPPFGVFRSLSILVPPRTPPEILERPSSTVFFPLYGLAWAPMELSFIVLLFFFNESSTNVHNRLGTPPCESLSGCCGWNAVWLYNIETGLFSRHPGEVF